MKLTDLLTVISTPTQKVKVYCAYSGRICFEGIADDLFEYSALDEKRIVSVSAEGDVLKLKVKNKPY